MKKNYKDQSSLHKYYEMMRPFLKKWQPSTVGFFMMIMLFMTGMSSSLQAQACSNPIAYAGSTEVCEGDVTAYTVTNFVNGATYNWTVSGSYGIILNSGLYPDGTPFVSVRWTLATPNQAWVKASISSPCINNGDKYDVVVYPTVNADNLYYQGNVYSGDNSTNAYYCHEGNGVSLSLSDTENGVIYKLLRISDDFEAGSITGNGSAMTFDNVVVENSSVPAASSTEYYAIATNTLCETEMIGTVSVHKLAEVSPGIIASASLTPRGVCTSPGPEFTSNADGSGGYGTIAYQWQYNFNGTGYTDIAGATSATYNSVALTTAGTYDFRRITYNNDANACVVLGDEVASNEVTIVVDAAPMAAVPADVIIGECKAYAIAATATGTGHTILWSLTDGTVALDADSFIDDKTLEDPTFLATAATGTYDLTMTVTDTYGCTAEASFTITVDDAPTAAVPADVTIGVCESYNIDATATGTGSAIIWTGTGATYLSAPDVEDPIFSASAPTGSYNLTMTVTDTYGCTDEASFTITVDDAPTAFVPTFNPTIGECESYAIDASATGTGHAILWSLTDGTVALDADSYFDDKTLEDPTFLATAATGTYDLTMTVTDTYGCTAEASFTITVDDAPTAVVPADVTIGVCESYNIDATATGTGSAIIWTGTGATYLSSPSVEDPIFSASAPTGSYSLTMTVTDTYGCTADATFTITVDDAPTAAVPALISALGNCKSYTIDATATGAGIVGGVATAPASIVWTGSGAMYLTSTTSEDPTFSTTNDGSYGLTMTVTDKYGCIAEASFTITVDAAPTALPGDDGEICVGQDYQIDATATGTSPLTYLWSPATYLSATDIEDPLFSGAPQGQYIYTLTVTDSYGCDVTSSDLTIDVFVSPNPNAGPDETVCNSTSYTMQAVDPVSGSSGVWSQTSGPGTAIFAAPTSNTSSVSVDVAGVYVFKWFETNSTCGYDDEDEVQITFIKGADLNATEMIDSPDISTITGTPVIVHAGTQYPSGIGATDASILVNALVEESNGNAFPTGTTISKVMYKETGMPNYVELTVADGDIAGKTSFLMSDVLGTAATPLVGHDDLLVEWMITLEGVTSPATIPVTMTTIAYIAPFGTGACYAELDWDEFSVTFRDATVDPVDDFSICDPNEINFDYEITYPIIENVDTDVKSDAKIVITDPNGDPLSLPSSATIAISYNGTHVNTYTFAGDYSTLYLSALLGNQVDPSAPFAAMQNPINGHNGLTDTWLFEINNANPTTYEVAISNMAIIGTVEYPFAGDEFEIIYVGADGVTIDAISNISTVSGAPVVVPVTVNYGDLDAQHIDPTVLVDALIQTSLTGGFPAGTKIIGITYEGNPVTFTAPYDLSNESSVRLSTVLGTTGTPLAGHHNRIDDWEFTITTTDFTGAIPVTVASIAYVDYTVCYSEIAVQEFETSYNVLEFDVNTPMTSCDNASVESTFDITYPVISNNPVTILTDAIITVDQIIPAGVVVDWDYEAGAASGTYTFPSAISAGTPINLSTIVGSPAPTPLNGHNGLTINWEFNFTGLPADDYVLTVSSIAQLDAVDFALTTNPTPVTQSFTVLSVPDATIAGVTSVYSGQQDVGYSVPVITGAGTPTSPYTWTLSPSDASNTLMYYDRAIEVDFLHPFVGDATLSVEVFNGYCSSTDEIVISVLPNTLQGQVKYYNDQESPMPSPFNSNYSGNTIPDYFWVSLVDGQFDFDEGDPTTVGSGVLDIQKVEAKWIEDATTTPPTITEYLSYFEFDFNLDPTVEYEIVVWDGGFLEESDLDQDLGYSWTWNNWDGVNATDALVIQLMSVGTEIRNAPYNFTWAADASSNYQFTGMLADVNTINVAGGYDITALDAFITNRRAVGYIPTFLNNTPNFKVAGLYLADPADFNTNNIFGVELPDFPFAKREMVYNWTSHAVDHNYYTYNEDNLGIGDHYLNIYYAAVGDVNASYVPEYGGFKAQPTMELSLENEMIAGISEVITIPVSMNRSAELGALTLNMSFRNDLIEVLEVNYGEDFARIDNENGRLSINWFSLDAASYQADEAILNITVRVLAEISSSTNLFTLEANSELADALAQPYSGIDLKTIAVDASSEYVAGSMAASNYPNPFKDVTTISYNLPENGKVTINVYDRMGQIVSTLVDQTQKAGVQNFELNRADLNAGAYVYRIILTGETQTYSVTKSMIVVN